MCSRSMQAQARLCLSLLIDAKLHLVAIMYRRIMHEAARFIRSPARLAKVTCD
jgi:hypothetical protein